MNLLGTEFHGFDRINILDSPVPVPTTVPEELEELDEELDERIR
jgi:hypothetical protein